MTGKVKYLAVSAGLLCIVMFLLFHYLEDIFLPLVIALILTYLINPLVNLVTQRGINRIFAILIVFSILIILFSGCGMLFVISLKAELGSVEVNLPEYARRLYEIIPLQIKQYLGIETPDKAYTYLYSALQELRGSSMDLARQALSVASRAFSSTLAFVLTLLGYVITPIYLFYFLADLPEIKGAMMALIPERYRVQVGTMAGEINDVLSAFVRGQLSVCAILAVLYSFGLYMIGIDLAILIGTLAGAAFIIPYVGTIMGIVLSVIMALLKFHDLLHPLLCVGWFALVQAVEGGLITPRMVGDKVGLHPVVTILALLVGGQIFGILGMLLALPVMAVLKVLLVHLLDSFRKSSFYTGC